MSLTVTNLKSFFTMPETVKLQEKLLAAMTLAQAERERVNSYAIPAFQEYSKKNQFFNDRGEPITNPDKLFTCDDDDACQQWYDLLDRLHKAHGSKLPEGYCPALVAENAVTEAENSLLDHAGSHLDPCFKSIYNMKHRERALHLFLNPPAE